MRRLALPSGRLRCDQSIRRSDGEEAAREWGSGSQQEQPQYVIAAQQFAHHPAQVGIEAAARRGGIRIFTEKQ
jgi:hypothetical protein